MSLRYTLLAALAVPVLADTTFNLASANFATYPQVPKTASINGFADRIYADLPTCAQSCVHESTGSTPCPYWDTGCLCIMPQFQNAIDDCIAKQCKGHDVEVATSLGASICHSAGAWYTMGASESAALNAAAGQAGAASATSSAAGSSSAAAQSSPTGGSSAASSSAASAGSQQGAASNKPASTASSPAQAAGSASSKPAEASSKPAGPSSKEAGAAKSSAKSSSGAASSKVAQSNRAAAAGIAFGAVAAVVAHAL